ncbi:helix-turn-helix domain-containing protein [Streptomyces sp. NPDC056910]|uniref:helix-turn-helix domain-containing protein n=1 Tax=Streptomyces sp. NPDC056910 TaxID=3345964 RepID=UPI003674C007
MKTKLQAARLTRGWSQAELMDAMEDAAGRLGFELPSRSSLKTQVSMFENGRRPPGPEYQALFC